MTELPSDYLLQWPGRFRFAQLVRTMAGPGSSARELGRPDVAADAILAGLVAEQDEAQVFDDLVQEGEFDAARRMLNDCPVFDEAGVSALEERLARERANSLRKLAARLSELGERADAAGLEVRVDHAGVESQWTRRRPSAEVELAAAETRLADDVVAKTGELRERLNAGAADLDPSWTETVQALLDSGYLRTAERMLDGTATDQLPGPEGVRKLPPLIWDRPAETILQWHLDGNKQHPLSFRKVEDPRALDLLTAYDHLAEGGESGAHNLAAAIDAFLGGSELAHRVTQRTGGFLTELHNVFLDPQTTGFFPRSRIRLFVADDGVTDIPADLGGLEPFVAVGPSLRRPDLASRGNAAIVTLEDLLRLIQIRSRRPVALLRLLGPQWQLPMFTGASADDLDRRLGSGEHERWLTLSWLVDLCGLGDLTAADAIAFETGLDSALIWLFFGYLDDSRGSAPALGEGAREIVRAWQQDRRISAAAEKAVLDGLGGSPSAALTFWAALALAGPGEPVSVGELAAIAADVAATPGLSDGVSVDWVAEVRSGAAELGQVWLVGADGGDQDPDITLRRCGVLEVLAGVAEQRLKATCELVAEQVKEAESESRRQLTMWQFEAHRHALTRKRQEYERLAADPAASPEALAAARQAMDEDTARILDADPALGGECDLGEVVAVMAESFGRTYEDIVLTRAADPDVMAAVNRALAEVLLYELLANAAQAMTDLGGGEIEVRVDASDDDDVLIHVRDSGHGVEVANAGRKIFRDGFSTRGSGRGRGLYTAQQLARRSGGDLTLEEAMTDHPVLAGAHFLLTLPRR